MHYFFVSCFLICFLSACTKNKFDNCDEFASWPKKIAGFQFIMLMEDKTNSIVAIDTLRVAIGSEYYSDTILIKK